MRTVCLGLCVLGLTIGISGQTTPAPNKMVKTVGSTTYISDSIHRTVQSHQLPSGTVQFQQRVVLTNVEIQTPTTTITADKAEQVGENTFELSGKVVFQAR